MIPSLWPATTSATSEPCLGGLGLGIKPIFRLITLLAMPLNQGALGSSAFPDIAGNTGFFATLRWMLVGVSSSPLGLPVFRRIPLDTFRRGSRAEPLGARVACVANATAALHYRQPGRLPHCLFRGLLSVHCSLRPAYWSGRFATLYSGGFGDVVAFVPAPIATDCGNIRRVGVSPTRVPRLVTPHQII